MRLHPDSPCSIPDGELGANFDQLGAHAPAFVVMVRPIFKDGKVVGLRPLCEYTFVCEKREEGDQYYMSHRVELGADDKVIYRDDLPVYWLEGHTS